MRYAIFNKTIYPIEKETEHYVWVDSHRFKKEHQRMATRCSLEWNGKRYLDLRLKLIEECDLKREQERIDADMVIDYLQKLSERYSNNVTRLAHSDAQIIEVGRVLGIIPK